jgi:hypothetical protein
MQGAFPMKIEENLYKCLRLYRGEYSKQNPVNTKMALL